jgi:hypothetical protein
LEYAGQLFRPVSSQLDVSLSAGGVHGKAFQNRSDNDIKNKWYSMMRKQKRISDQLLNEFAPGYWS